ncbi:acetyl-CoA carboxylase biotin carboxyl carrier protein [Hungatella effluvii]|uniref:Biotin carboxyl carrier protein of acetyl-CoA carboxylase n=1 Tax=Hungatella effluvii TaxID=1096246 RepID=A0A2V3Y6U5_9FIRM|nr:acetyl-CoA carboxylase biotin carboxyl carrier protein [Hungatella effluvii]PXX52348.1 acetyl-CoA carboxylase biotin carboxyl carrier protein [Hungatella effluvii]
MEINDIIRLMQAVSENGLTSFKIEEGNLKLSIKKEKEQIITVAGNSTVQQMIPASGVAAEMAAIPAAEFTAPAGSGKGAQTAENTAAAIDSDKIVASPLVGTFYNSSSPDAEPFVKVGDTVKKGQTLGIIEAMKLMNEIESEFDGVVEAVLVTNENVVEYGQPLFRIR